MARALPCPFPSCSSQCNQKLEQLCSVASGCSCHVTWAGEWVNGAPLLCRPSLAPQPQVSKLWRGPCEAVWGRDQRLSLTQVSGGQRDRTNPVLGQSKELT